MEQRGEDRDFQSFQRDGSPEALARVFDATAPRLLLLAGHLVRSAVDAEDLVQATFLQAMRGASRWDGKRPVLVWLAGILRHRALDLQRRAGRTPEPTHQDAEERCDPSELAADRELFERIVDRIERMEAPYREVLALRLVYGLEPTAIAHALGRAPGTVRMQCKRGLEQLRAALPERSALLGGLMIDFSRGLGAVREAVLADAPWIGGSAAGAGSAALAAPAQATKLAAPLVLGGTGLMKATWIVAAAAALLLTLFSVTRALTPEPLVERGEAPLVARTLASKLDRSLPAAPSIALSEHSLEVPAEDVRVAAFEPDAPPPPSPAFTISVHYESSHRPAEGVGVYLRGLEAGAPGREEVTDQDGLILYEDLPEGRYLAWLDRTSKSTDVHVRPGATLKLFVPRGLTVSGRVVDLEKRPIPGAEVFRVNEAHHDLLQRIARTDRAGGFRLRDVEEGIELIARAAGWQPSRIEVVRLEKGSEVHLELVLGARGHRLRGVVTHWDGRPASGALVAICVDEDAREEIEGSSRDPLLLERAKPMDREAFFLRANDHGVFASDEVPAGHALILARPIERGTGEVAWETAWIRPGEENEIHVPLRGGSEVVGTVLDLSGMPLEKLQLEAEWEGMPSLGQMEDELGPWMSDARAVSASDGSFRLVGLLPGDYDLRVRALPRAGDPKGVELLREEHMVEEGVTVRWDPRVSHHPSIAVRVLDRSGVPLEGWAVGATDRPGHLPGFQVFGTLTDVSGRARTGPLRPQRRYDVLIFAPAPAEGEAVPIPFAVHAGVLPGPEELVLTLGDDQLVSGSIEGIWSDERAARDQLELQLIDWNPGIRREPGEDGRFLFAGLPAGTYRLVAISSDTGNETDLGQWTLGPGERFNTGTLVE